MNGTWSNLCPKAAYGPKMRGDYRCLLAGKPENQRFFKPIYVAPGICQTSQFWMSRVSFFLFGRFFFHIRMLFDPHLDAHLPHRCLTPAGPLEAALPAVLLPRGGAAGAAESAEAEQEGPGGHRPAAAGAVHGGPGRPRPSANGG